MKPRIPLLVGSILALSGAACHIGLDKWEGEFIDYYSSPSLEVCAGTHEYVDRFVPFVANELGIAAPTGLEYQWLDDETLSDRRCRDGKACARRRRAFSPDPVLLHELVHAVAWSNDLNQWPFFTEGIATAYDFWQGDRMGARYGMTPDPLAPLPDPRPHLTEDYGLDGIDYGLSGSFVMFLLSRHGPAKFVSLIQRLPRPRHLSTLRALFRDVYAVELDDEAERFMARAPCEDDPFPVLVYDCTMPEVPWQAGVWTYNKALDCAEDDVVGGTAPDRSWRSIHSVTLNIPTSGRYSLHLESDEDEILVQVGACFGCPWEPRYAIVQSGALALAEAEFDAGLYYARIRGDSSRPSEVKVTLLPAP